MVFEICFPAQTQLNGKESGSFYRDAFVVTVNQSDLPAKYVYHSIFAYLPDSVQRLMKIRNAIVKYLGFSASNSTMALAYEDICVGNKAGFLTIENLSDTELVCAAYEKNMDMWISVLKVKDDQFVISTLVNLKTKTGKVYMACIVPFHKLIAKHCIKQALKAGRL